jgi:hypothetical protein
LSHRPALATRSRTQTTSTTSLGACLHARVFGRPTTANSVRHSFANTLDLQNMTHDQLQSAAKRLAHVNPDTLARLYVWGGRTAAVAAGSRSSSSCCRCRDSTAAGRGAASVGGAQYFNEPCQHSVRHKSRQHEGTAPTKRPTRYQLKSDLWAPDCAGLQTATGAEYPRPHAAPTLGSVSKQRHAWLLELVPAPLRPALGSASRACCRQVPVVIDVDFRVYPGCIVQHRCHRPMSYTWVMDNCK